jgi:tRNA(Ile)-lysidine synthase
LLASADLDTTLNDLLEAPRWYVALSGGVDSTVLVHLLHDWCQIHPEAPPLAAIHDNHALQAASDQWQAHCEQCCTALGLECFSQRVEVSVGASVEAQARLARYEAFETRLEPGEVLFLAHHLDDQVETFFLRLMRGAGLEGLAGMPASRALGLGQLARPLLGTARDDIEQYAAAHQLPCIEDPSNADVRHDRNYLRHEVLPMLSQRWPAYRRSVGRASGHLQVASQLLQDSLAPATGMTSVTGDPGVSLLNLVDVSGPVASATLRARLRLWGLRVPDQAPLEEFLRQLRDAAPDASPRLQWDGNILQRYRDAVYLMPEGHDIAPPAQPFTLTPQEHCDVAGVGVLSLQPTQGAGLALSPADTLQVRWRSGGEQCRPSGRPAASLKKILQQWHVPPWWRERLPLLYLDEELLAVADLALCESSRLAQAESDRQRWKLVWEKRPFSGLRD